MDPERRAAPADHPGGSWTGAERWGRVPIRYLDRGQRGTLGYAYRRIEDAHYARNAEIKASAQGRALAAIVCQTLDEFIANSTGYDMLAAA